jgi:crotonobetainyl-CoA:carnitine CoA-transferase CaiB-like acyl-CoA transferase
MAPVSMAQLPLDGVKVLDFTRQMSGPYGTVILSDFGAEVIKVESLPHGDGSRAIGRGSTGPESGMFQMWNRGKRSLALDLRSTEGLRVVERMVAECDVLAENYRPGVADAIGIGYERMISFNPRLIYCSVSAFGPNGPWSTFPGTDPVVQAMSGVMSLTGEHDGEPVLVGVPIADFTGALLCAMSIIMGLRAREQTGRGQKVDVSMLLGLVWGLSTRLANYWQTGEPQGRWGRAHSSAVPYDAFRTLDGRLVVAGVWGEAKSWPRFCDAIGRPDLLEDPRYATGESRRRHREELTDLLQKHFLQRTAGEWEERFHRVGALFGRVQSLDEVLGDPHIAGEISPPLDGDTGGAPQLMPIVKFSDTPGRIARPAPRLGEQSREVLEEFGFSGQEIDQLVGQGTVGAG